MKRILFIGHDAGRTGAPFVLLYLLQYLRAEHPELRIDLLLLRGGELEKDYSNVANVAIVPEKSFLDRLRSKAVRTLTGKRAFRLPAATGGVGYDIVVGNTVVTLECLEVYKRRGSATVCWLHELDYVVKSFFPIDRFVELSSSVDHFVCGSGAVKEMLKRLAVVSPATVVYEPFPIPDPAGIDAPEVRRLLGIAENEFLVAGGGTLEWRKAPDLFLQIAARVSGSGKLVRFVWVGGPSPSTANFFEQVQYDMAKMEISPSVIFTGIVPDPEKYLATANVFALTSREDPFPLMALTAAAFGKPIVCFDKSGGVPEFVGDGAGVVVPYGEVEEFARAILEYHGDRGRWYRDGQVARDRLRTGFESDASLSRIAEIIFKNGV